MTLISEIIERELKKTNDLKQVAKRMFFNIKSEDFKTLFMINIDKIIAERKIIREFEFNDQNKEIINQLYFHLVGCDEKFIGNLQKGIMIVGRNGVGKTLLLNAYCNVRTALCGTHGNIYHSKKLIDYIKQNGYDNYIKKELMIDDIGKESREIIDFGTKLHPIEDLISFRYDAGALTFATSNYNMDTLTEFYGLTTTDRFKEMFNIIELKGNSFRK